MVLGVRNALHGQLHVLLQVIKVLLLESQLVSKLGCLSLQQQVLFSEILSLHLLQQLLGLQVLEVDLVEVLFEQLHLQQECLDVQVLFLDFLFQRIVVCIVSLR